MFTDTSIISSYTESFILYRRINFSGGIYLTTNTLVVHIKRHKMPLIDMKTGRRGALLRVVLRHASACAHTSARETKNVRDKGSRGRSYKEIRKEIGGRSGRGTGRNRARDEETRWRRARYIEKRKEIHAATSRTERRWEWWRRAGGIAA